MNPAKDQARWIRWTAIGLAGYALLFTLYTLLQPLGETGRLIVGDVVYIPANIAAGILSLSIIGATRDRRLGWAWGLIGLGFISWAVADTLWAWSELVQGITPESPHVTDIFYLLMYPLFFAGLLVYPTGRWDRLSRTKLLLDVSALAVTAGMFSWNYLIAPILHTEATDVLGRAIDLAYPIADLVLIWALARIYFATPPQMMRSPILLLIGGIGLNVVADIWYALLNASNSYYTGHIVDAFWLVGSVIACGGALAQHRALRSGASSEPDHADSGPALRAGSLSAVRRSQYFLPYLALMAALVIGLLTSSRDREEWGLLLGSSVIVAIIIVRQLLTISENIRLNEKLAQRVEEVTLLNRQVQQANEELRQIDQFKSEFVSNISHELRTPLTSILGYTELLLDAPDGPLTPLQTDSLQTVFNNAQRLLGLVNDLLDLSRVESGRFTICPVPLAPAPLLCQLVEEMRLQAENKDLTLEADLPDDLPMLTADGLRIAQVLNNLLSNAIKFTPAGGQVRVRGYCLEAERGPATHATDGGDTPAPPGLPQGRWLVVRVEDTGPGIPAAELPHLFTRFYRTAEAQHQAIKGTGLGLYVAKAIVEAHHGYIGVESQPGRGSTFWFALPLSPEYEQAGSHG